MAAPTLIAMMLIVCMTSNFTVNAFGNRLLLTGDLRVTGARLCLCQITRHSTAAFTARLLKSSPTTILNYRLIRIARKRRTCSVIAVSTGRRSIDEAP